MVFHRYCREFTDIVENIVIIQSVLRSCPHDSRKKYNLFVLIMENLDFMNSQEIDMLWLP